MAILVRRSNLLAPVTTPRFVEGAWRRNADAVTLDLEDSVPDALKEEARLRVKDAIAQVSRGGAEVFVRVNKGLAYADIEASVWKGLAGIVLPQVDSPDDVAEVSEILSGMERRRGLEKGVLQLVLLLESASALWRVRDIIKADPRVTQVGLDESDLAASLGVTPVTGCDPFVYARGRLVVEATAAGVQPVWAPHSAAPLGDFPSPEDMLEIATASKNLGFKGMVCPHPGWVGPVNSAFTPTESQVEYYTQVRNVFAQAIAAGTAAAPFHGRMIDVPVDEWAKVVLETAAACALRDAQKQAALGQEETPGNDGAAS